MIENGLVMLQNYGESMKQQVVINSEQYIEVTIYDIVILQIPKKC